MWVTNTETNNDEQTTYKEQKDTKEGDMDIRQYRLKQETPITNIRIIIMEDQYIEKVNTTQRPAPILKDRIGRI